MIGYGESGTTHDFFAYNAAGQIWSGAAFVAWNAANFASYRITAMESTGSGKFTGTAPAGTVHWELRERAATLADSIVVWTGDGPRETWTVVTDSVGALVLDKT